MSERRYGPHGMEGMVTVERLNVTTDEESRLEKMEAESYFSQHAAVLVIDLFPILDAKIKEYGKALRDYNEKLKTAGHSIRVRGKQTVTSSNRKTYHYHGRYVYTRKDAPEMLPPLQPNPTDFQELSQKDYEALKPTEKARYTKQKNAHERHQKIHLKQEKENDLPQDEPVPRDRWIYMGKLEDLLDDPAFVDVFNQIGNPPFHPLEGLRVQRVKSQGKETNHVILPQNVLHQQNLSRYLNGLTHFKLRG